MLSIYCDSRIKSKKKKIGRHLEKITKMKPLRRNKLPLEKDNWKKFGKNNLEFALNILYAENEKPFPAYVSKYSSNPEKQVIL